MMSIQNDEALTITTVIAAIGRRVFSLIVIFCLLQIVLEYTELIVLCDQGYLFIFTVKVPFKMYV